MNIAIPKENHPDETRVALIPEHVAKLAAAGITTGCNADGTNFCPGKSVTRGQMAAFLKRASALSS